LIRISISIAIMVAMKILRSNPAEKFSIRVWLKNKIQGLVAES